MNKGQQRLINTNKEYYALFLQEVVKMKKLNSEKDTVIKLYEEN